MIGRIRSAALASVLTIAGGLLLEARPAQAQTNTYADFPFQQGSLFYKPIPYKSKKKVVKAPAAAPRTVQPAPGYTTAPRVVQPAPGYRTVQPSAAPVAPQPRYYYYYYPTYPR